MATVSVIMPAYNVAAYIGAAIESVKAQTCTDWELLIADDGSTDETAGIARACAGQDARIRLLQQPNRGISAARNLAIAESTGGFLAFLDSDDLWEPGYLAAQLATFERHPEVDIVSGNGWYLGSRRHGRPVRPYPDQRPQPTLATILADEESIFIMAVVRRRVFDTIGGFDEALRTNEDYDFWVRAAIAGFRFMRNDEPLGHYRRRNDSASASEIRMLTGILRVFDKLRPQLADRPAELGIAEAQVARFERERLAAGAREALDTGKVDLAAEYLADLYRHSGGAAVKLAGVMARWTPRLLARAYRLRRARQGAA
jgi:glycosyltransferase involved in cell wall biosynthesis